MKKAKKYIARKGSKYSDKDAQLFGREITKVISKYGLSTPEILLGEAKSKSNKLHKYFEWKNAKAAKQYRLQQAREIHSCVVEIVVASSKTPIEIRSFYSVHDKKKGQCYVTIQEIIKTESYRNELLKKMMVTLKNLQNMIDLFLKYE